MDSYAKSKGFKDFEDLDKFLEELRQLFAIDINEIIETGSELCEEDEELPFRRQSASIDTYEDYQSAALGAFADAFDEDITEDGDIEGIMNYLGLD